MNDSYVGLHGRDPYDTGHDKTTGPDHFVPEFWEDLNRGICPRCGRTVTWNEERDRWLPDDSLTVLVLTEEEIDTIALVAAGLPSFKKTGLPEMIRRQYDLNRDLDG